MVNIFTGNKSSRRRNKEKTKTRSNKFRLTSISRKSRKNKSEAEKEEKKSNPLAPPITVAAPLTSSKSSKSPRARTPHRDREEVGSSKDKSKLESMMAKERNGKEDKEEDSVNEEELARKKSFPVLPKDAPRQVKIKHRDVNDEEAKKFLAKYSVKKNEPVVAKPPMDEKSMMLMDRVIKKTYPMKYAKKEKWKMMMTDEDQDFFNKPTVGKKNSTSFIINEDTYDHVPKLAEVKDMPDEDVYMQGTRKPFWTREPLDPDDEDMKDTDPPVSVGTDHVEQFQDKKLTLKSAKDTKLVLDEWAPLVILQKRDDEHFHPHLVFSNTIRSLVNVQAVFSIKERMTRSKTKSRSNSEEEATQYEQETLTVTILRTKPKRFHYDRNNPILTARDRMGPEAPPVSSSSSSSASASSPKDNHPSSPPEMGSESSEKEDKN